MQSIALLAALRDKSGKAASRAINCILRTQVILHGRRTIWGQQHDPLTLLPVAARNFEPASLASEESAYLLMLLMQQRPSTDPMTNAIHDGIAWLQAMRFGARPLWGKDRHLKAG